MKGCNEVGYYKGLNDQNTKALTDTVEYYKGNYTKAIYKAHNERLAMEMAEKDKKLREYEQTIQDIQKFQEDRKAVYLSGSNLNKTL